MTDTNRANSKAAFVLADAMRQLGVTRVFGLILCSIAVTGLVIATKLSFSLG